MSMKKGLLATAIVCFMSLALTASAFAGGPNSCPWFDTGMVNAAALMADVNPFGSTVTRVVSDPATPETLCWADSNTGRSLFLSAGPDPDQSDPSIHEAFLHAVGPGSITLGRAGGPLTPAQSHARRTQILQSFVWNTVCAPALP